MVIASFAIYCMNYGYMLLHLNWWGKWATGITALGVFLHIFDYCTALAENDVYICSFDITAY